MPQMCSFTFNGRSSEELHVINCDLVGGIEPDYISGSKSLSYDNSIGQTDPVNFTTSKDLLTYDLTLYFDPDYLNELAPIHNNPLAQDFINDLMRWLITDTFCEFRAEDNIGKVDYLQWNGQIGLWTDLFAQGYITISLISNSWHSWSDLSTAEYDLSDVNIPTTITLMNDSNINIDDYYYPLIEFKRTKGDGDFAISNLSFDDEDFVFTDLLQDEIITVDNDFRQITSSQDLIRYDNFNYFWLKLRVGENRFILPPNCVVKFYYRYPIIGI